MWRSIYEAFMKPLIGRSTGKVDIYAVNWSELGGCRVRMWMETLKRGVEKRVQELARVSIHSPSKAKPRNFVVMINSVRILSASGTPSGLWGRRENKNA